MTSISKIAAALGIVAGIGVAALPIATFAATDNANISYTVNSTIGGSDVDCEDVTMTSNAGTQATASCSISVSSNDAVSVAIDDADGVLNLVKGGDAIAPIAVTETGTGDLTQNGWGYRFTTDNNGGGGFAVVTGYDKYHAITASGAPVTVASSTSAVTNAAGHFDFAAKTALGQAPGTYTDDVVITITAGV
jgi:hypothetical protein